MPKGNLKPKREKMRPKYNFFLNTKYALSGLCEIYKNETSFKIELFFVVILLPVCLLLSIDLALRLWLISSLLFILFAECVNSALERLTDLACKQIHPLAKAAKDASSAAVFIAITNAAIAWLIVLCELARLKGML